MALVIRSEQEWKQAAFNGAFRGLRWQGWRKSEAVAVHEGRLQTLCAVRGQVGCCGAGWLMRDEDVLRAVQNTPNHEITFDPSVHDLTPILRDSFYADQGFLDDVVGSHDSAASPRGMERRFRNLARKHSLTIPDEPSR